MKTIETKHCSGCERDLLHTMFDKHSGNEDGLSGWCRDCGGNTYKPVTHKPTYCTSLATKADITYARALLTKGQETLLFALNPFKDHLVNYKEAATTLGMTEAGVSKAMMRLKGENPYVYYRFKEITRHMNRGAYAIRRATPTDPKQLILYERYNIVKRIFC